MKHFPLRLLAALSAVAAFGCECGGETLSTTYDLCVDPAEVSFGDVVARTVETRTLNVQNCGNIPFDGLEAVFTPADDGDDEDAKAYRIIPTEVPSPVDAGARFLLPVRFRPSTARDYSAKLDFFVADTEGTLATVVLDGRGVPPDGCDLLLGPDPLVFSETEAGLSSEPMPISLTNQGTGDCELSAVRLTSGHDDFDIESVAPTVLEPGANATVDIVFSPNEAGQRTGVFSVVTAGELEYVVDLQGPALPSERCRITIEPAPLSFPRASVNFNQTVAEAEVKNNGELPCTYTGAAITELESDYTIESAPETPLTLNPGEGAPITVTFAPTDTGPREGVLTLSTEEEPDVDIALIGFADPTPTCGVIFDPSPLSFPARGVGLTEEVTVTIENASEVDCHIAGTHLSDDAAPEFLLVDSAPQVTLGPGETTTTTLSYTPIAAAPSTGLLFVDFDDDTDQELELLGFGDYAEVVLTPGLQFFGTITEGCVSQEFPGLLSNIGPVAARLDSMAFSALSDPNFQLLTPLDDGTMILPGESIDLSLRMMSGPSPAPHSGHLEVFTTGTAEPVVREALFGRTASIDEANLTEVFIQTDAPAVDILFVVDNSGSMLHEQTSLAANFSAFINFTAGLDIDYHIGVVTTDTDDDDAGKLVAPYIANVGPDASADPVADFVNMVNVGTDGSGTERGLEAAALALSEPLVSTENGGFLRPEAFLSVIFVSDEDDSSPGDVNDYIETLLEAKGFNSQALIASAIAGEPPAGCNGGGNDATSGDRYYDITLALGGLFESICTPDWATTMEEIGISTFSALTNFTLSRIPDESTIVVIVNGEVVPPDALNGWEYDEDSNSISFNGTSVPDAGEQVEISYTAECLLP